MGLLNFLGLSKKQNVTTVQMITENSKGFYSWNGHLYESDIVRACVRPAALAGSKLEIKHIREDSKGIAVNPEPYMRFLLEEPNQLMSMSKLLEKMFTHVKLNNNAFALITRDDNGLPTGIIPIVCSTAEVVTIGADNETCLRFFMPDGKIYVFKYADVIHLRRDCKDGSVFGTPNTEALRPLMNIVTTTDQGIVAAIKNSSVIRWLLKFNIGKRPEDIEELTKKFADQFMNVKNGTGVAGVDTSADAVQVDPKDYVPNSSQMKLTTERLYSLFGVNEKIVQNKANEDETNAYFEGDVEPLIIDLEQELTRKLFSRRERGCGNRIACDAGMINAASLKTKLSYVAMVDRGAMTPNEWRRVFNLAPIEGGDKPIRRLDTAPVSEKGGNDE